MPSVGSTEILLKVDIATLVTTSKCDDLLLHFRVASEASEESSIVVVAIVEVVPPLIVFAKEVSAL